MANGASLPAQGAERVKHTYALSITGDMRGGEATLTFESGAQDTEAAAKKQVALLVSEAGGTLEKHLLWPYIVLDPKGVTLRSHATYDKAAKLKERLEEGEVVEVFFFRREGAFDGAAWDEEEYDIAATVEAEEKKKRKKQKKKKKRKKKKKLWIDQEEGEEAEEEGEIEEKQERQEHEKEEEEEKDSVTDARTKKKKKKKTKKKKIKKKKKKNPEDISRRIKSQEEEKEEEKEEEEEEEEEDKDKNASLDIEKGEEEEEKKIEDTWLPIGGR
eukprot:s1639_g9.t1